VLWRFLGLVAHGMRASTRDERWSLALNGYLRRHPLRGAGYVVAAWVGALLVIELMALPAVVLLESLHVRPRSAADVGATMLALFGVLALWCALGRWLRRLVVVRVNRWRSAPTST
jgi:hypothetical protein